MGWWVGGRFKREDINIYTWGWFMLLCGRNQYNIVKKLSSNQKKKKIPRIQTFLTSYAATTLVQAHIISHLFSLLPALLSCNLFLRKQLEGRNPAKTQVMSWFSSFQSPPKSSLKPKSLQDPCNPASVIALTSLCILFCWSLYSCPTGPSAALLRCQL